MLFRSIPLGGNRAGEARTYLNLMITMVLGGLWHGASARFLLWGAIHGVFLCAEKLGTSLWARATGNRAAPIGFSGISIVATFAAVSLTWIPFRATDTRQCFVMLKGLFHGPVHGYPEMNKHFALIAAVFLLHCWWARTDFVISYQARPLVRAS